MRYRKLRGAILQAGYKHSEVAKAVGLSSSNFSRRMTDAHSFTLTEAYTILELLKLPREDISIYFPYHGKEAQDA